MGSAQDLFRPAATRYRRRLQTLVITGIVGFGLVFLVLFLPDVLLLSGDPISLEMRAQMDELAQKERKRRV